jgi:hypothetical protein
MITLPALMYAQNGTTAAIFYSIQTDVFYSIQIDSLFFAWKRSEPF